MLSTQTPTRTPLNAVTKPQLYPVAQKLILVQDENTTLDQFLRGKLLPELAKLQRRQDNSEIVKLAFCFRLVGGIYKAMFLWREPQPK